MTDTLLAARQKALDAEARKLNYDRKRQQAIRAATGKVSVPASERPPGRLPGETVEVAARRYKREYNLVYKRIGRARYSTMPMRLQPS